MWSASCCNQHNSSWRLLLYFIQVEWKRLAEKKLVLYYKTIDLSIIYVQMQRILYTIYATWFCFWGCSLELSRLHVLMETQNHLSCLGDQALRFLFCQECAAPAAPSSYSIVSWAVCQESAKPLFPLFKTKTVSCPWRSAQKGEWVQFLPWSWSASVA